MAGIEDSNKRLFNYLEQGTQELRNYLNMNVVSGHERELERQTKYYLYWHFYEGRHFRDYNDSMLAFNYVRAFINKVNAFLLGDTGFSFQVTTYYNDVISEEVEKSLEELLMYHWRRSNKAETAQELLQMGSVCGDVWAMPYWDAVKKFVKIKVLDSRHIYPEFKDGDVSVTNSIVVRQPMEKRKDDMVIKVTRYTKDKVQEWFQKSTMLILNPGEDSQFTRKEKDVYLFKETENPLGFIPVVHIKNKPASTGYYSYSDAADILKLNKVFNEMNQEMKVIMDYYVTPVTVVTGATIKNAQRGVGSIWSGLPSEANVFNLGLDADMSSMSQFIKDVKSYMHEISDVPENVLGKTQAISGTSASALRLTYQPLVQQADLKALTYGEGIAEINSMILAMLKIYDGENKKYLEAMKILKAASLEVEDIRVSPVFAYGFPTDRMGILQEATMEVQLKVGSRKEIANRLNKNNIPDLFKEIDEDAYSQAFLSAQINELAFGAGGGSGSGSETTSPETPTPEPIKQPTVKPDKQQPNLNKPS